MPDRDSVAYLESVFAENMEQERHNCSELLFQFSLIELGEFEMVIDFIDSFRTISLLEAATIFWSQACRTMAKLQSDDIDLAKQKILQRFVNRCIQQYAFLSYGAQCGIRNLQRYLQRCVTCTLRDAG